MKEKKKREIASGSTIPSASVVTRPSLFFSLIENHINQVFFVLLLSVAVYGNSVFNQFALDDGMVLSENEYVLQGISGIPDILTHDSFYGAIGETKNLTGGRYRPFSQIAYAIEISVFGMNPLIHHLFNVFYFAVTALIFLLFLRRFIFKSHPVAAFIAVVIFIIHPVHTEVVANIKSRDEIFSLLFLLLTIYFLLNYILYSKKVRHFGISLLCYVLALLSKENGLTFVILIPVSLYFLTKEKLILIIRISAPYILVALVYIAARILLIGVNNNEVSEVMDNPYVLATPSEKYATIFFVLLKYFQLLVFPHPLTYDYSYNQISYRNFSDGWVCVSLLLHFLMMVYVVKNFIRKYLLAWCVLFYAGSIFIVSNIAFNIGAPMAERFLYQPSVAFIIFLVESLRRSIAPGQLNFRFSIPLASLVLLAVIIISCYATIRRNKIWSSDEVLFLSDVKTSANSARANTYAGVALIRLCDRSGSASEKHEYSMHALDNFRRSLAIKSDYITTLLNMGVAYSRLDSVEEAEAVWNRARSINPYDRNFIVYDRYLAESYYQRGLQAGVDKNIPAAIDNLENSIKYDPANVEAWYNLGGAYYSVEQYANAKTCWEKTLQLNPQNQQAARGLASIQVMGY